MDTGALQNVLFQVTALLPPALLEERARVAGVHVSEETLTENQKFEYEGRRNPNSRRHYVL